METPWGFVGMRPQPRFWKWSSPTWLYLLVYVSWGAMAYSRLSYGKSGFESGVKTNKYNWGHRLNLGFIDKHYVPWVSLFTKIQMAVIMWWNLSLCAEYREIYPDY